VLPFNETRGLGWPQVALAAVTECKRVDAALLVVDTLSQFAGLTGDRENNSGDALEAMQPLQQAASEGIGVMLVRHERKSGGDVGDSGRGSSAFAGAVDIVLSLRRLEGNSPKNRRLLQSLSRFQETPADLLIELKDGGYVPLGEPGETAVKDAKDMIFAVAPETEAEAVGMKDLMTNVKVSRQTAQRALDELVREGMLSRIGKGRKSDPFRYFIAEIPFCPTSNIEGQKEMNPSGPCPDL
jgi:Bacterial regulatory proteins, gntR family